MKQLFPLLMILTIAGCTTGNGIQSVPERKIVATGPVAVRETPAAVPHSPRRAKVTLEGTHWELELEKSGFKSDASMLPETTFLQIQNGIYRVHGDGTMLYGHYEKRGTGGIHFTKGISAQEKGNTADFFRSLRERLQKADSFRIEDSDMTVYQGQTPLLKFHEKSVKQ